MQETSTLKILNCVLNKSVNMHNCDRNKKSLMDTKIELNKRFGMPIYIPLISLLCSFLLASRKDKKTYAYDKYLYFFISFLVLVLSEMVVRYSGVSWKHTIIYYFLPILIAPFLYLFLIRKFKYENLY